MIIKNEKTYRGKFRYESNRAKTGKISIPAKLVRLESFPFVSSSNVTITFRDDYLIIEKVNNGRVEPVDRDLICATIDCKNNSDGRCSVKPDMDNKGHCLDYVFNRYYFDKSLHDSVSRGMLNDNKAK